MRRWGVIAAVAFSAIAAGDSHAQFISGSIETKPLFSGTQLVGCSVEYAAAVHDHTYRQGALTGVSGNVTLIMPQDGRPPGMMFKLLGMDFKDVSGKDPSFFQIADARVLVDDFKVGSGAPMPCENPKGQCSIHSAEEWFSIVRRMVEHGKLSVTYARKRRGIGVNVDIAFDPEKVRPILTCVQRLSR